MILCWRIVWSLLQVLISISTHWCFLLCLLLTIWKIFIAVFKSTLSQLINWWSNIHLRTIRLILSSFLEYKGQFYQEIMFTNKITFFPLLARLKFYWLFFLSLLQLSVRNSTHIAISCYVCCWNDIESHTSCFQINFKSSYKTEWWSHLHNICSLHFFNTKVTFAKTMMLTNKTKSCPIRSSFLQEGHFVVGWNCLNLAVSYPNQSWVINMNVDLIFARYSPLIEFKDQLYQELKKKS